MGYQQGGLAAEGQAFRERIRMEQLRCSPRDGAALTL